MVTDEISGEERYEIQLLDENENIIDVDTYPVTFYRDSYWKNRIKSKLKETVDKKSTEDGFDFGEEWAELKKEWIGHFRVVEEEKGKEGGEEEESEYEWDEDYLEEKAEEKLNSPELLSFIDRCIHHHLTGETKNALLVFLTYITALIREPNVLRPTGESAIGKSFLVTRVARLIPESMKIVREGFSKMAPWNKAEPTSKENVREWNLWGKVVIILEEENSEEFLEQFRSVLSHDEPVISYEVTDTESKSRDTLVVNMNGWPAYVGLQVGGKMDEQEETRAMSLTPDSGSEKFSKAQWFNARKSETPWLENLRKRDTEIVKKMVEKLDRYHVLIPNREKIQKQFPSRRKRHMRDWKQFSSLIEAVTALHQYQRPKIEIDGEDYLIAHPDDAEVALTIAENALIETLSNVDARARDFWVHISQYDRVAGYSGLLKEYKKCFSGEEISRATMRNKYVEVLRDRGLLEVKQGNGRNPNLFYASGQLPSLSKKMEKLVEAAHDNELEGSTFELLTSERIGPENAPKLKNCKDIFDGNPIEVESEETFEKLWSRIGEFPDIVRVNRDVIETGYELDYKRNNGKEVKPEKEDVPELSEAREEEDVPELSGDSGEEGGANEENQPSKKELDSVDGVLGDLGKPPNEISDDIGMELSKVKKCLSILKEKGLAKKKPDKMNEDMLWFEDG